MSVSRNVFDGVEVYNGNLYLFGGSGPNGYSTNIEKYSPVDDSWSTVGNISNEVQGIATAQLGGKIYIIGGRDADGQELSDVEIFDPETNEISSGSPMVIPIQQAAATVFEGKVYLFGGHSSTNSKRPLFTIPLLKLGLEKAPC